MFTSFVRQKAIQTFGSSNFANSILRLTTQIRMSRRESSDLSGHSKIKVVDHGDFTVTIVPALRDNFMYLVKPTNSKIAFVIDPVDYKAIAREANILGTGLESILCTHHHADHDGGNEPLKGLYPQLNIFGIDERISGINKKISGLDKLTVCGLDVTVLHTPCHTSGHSCYIVKSKSGSSAVFVGDTLFNAGCGRLFEGTPGQLLSTVNHILDSVEDDDKMYFSHEYSSSNIKFALSVDPENIHLKQRQNDVIKLREDSEPTTPSTFGLEKLINPFLRFKEAALKKSTGGQSDVEVIGKTREMKDSF